MTEFPCVTCGADTFIRQSKATCAGLTHRTRICKNGHAFHTYQNGGGEVFSAYFVPGLNRGTIEYQKMKDTYQRLAIICEVYGNRRISAALERARQRAGVTK